MKKYSKKNNSFLFNNKELLLEKLSECDFSDFNDTKNMLGWDKSIFDKDIDTSTPDFVM